MKQAMSVLTSNAQSRWYTPPHIIEKARQTMGTIDLDPASEEAPQKWIQAETYYDLCIPPSIDWLEEKAKATAIKVLSRSQLERQPPWEGNVWLNPPFYDSPLWVNRMIHDHQKTQNTSMLLVNTACGYKWWERLWRLFPVVMLEERLCFINGETGKPEGQAKKGQTIAYLGKDIATFTKVWSAIGRVILGES